MRGWDGFALASRAAIPQEYEWVGGRYEGVARDWWLMLGIELLMLLVGVTMLVVVVYVGGTGQDVGYRAWWKGV